MTVPCMVNAVEAVEVVQAASVQVGQAAEREGSAAAGERLPSAMLVRHVPRQCKAVRPEVVPTSIRNQTLGLPALVPADSGTDSTGPARAAVDLGLRIGPALGIDPAAEDLAPAIAQASGIGQGSATGQGTEIDPSSEIDQGSATGQGLKIDLVSGIDLVPVTAQ